MKVPCKSLMKLVSTTAAAVAGTKTLTTAEAEAKPADATAKPIEGGRGNASAYIFVT